MKFKYSWTLAAALLVGSSLTAAAQTNTPLTNGQPPDNIIYGFLLTDGTLFLQGGLLFDWYRFTPDQNGSYLNGNFSYAASLPADYIPYATSGGVLPDGRVLLIGGEYLEQDLNLVFAFTNKIALYDPVADTWTPVKPPAGWTTIGDSPWTILPNGTLLLGQKFTTRAAVLDPKTLTWTEVGTTGKNDFNAEEGWTLLPDGSVLTVDVLDHPNTERYLPTQSRWISAGKTPGNLQGSDSNSSRRIVWGNGQVYIPPGEVGPAILRPDGTVFATGADCNLVGTGPDDCITPTLVGHTAICHPGATLTSPGTWTAGPNFPAGLAAGDQFAVLLPSGNVFVETNPPGTSDGVRAKVKRMQRLAASRSVTAQTATPLYRCFEFDGTNLIYEPVADDPDAPSMLVLPTGEVFFMGLTTKIYASTGTYRPEWAPVITSAPTTITHGNSYSITGTQFNGLSQANAYGDEFQVATNYPLVRLTNFVTGHVTYARTHDHSSMGVATGSLSVTTHFDVPAGIETGKSLLEVVANGIPSLPLVITVN